MDTIVQNTWGLKEAKDAGLAMPEMRFPELENAVAAEAREDVDRVLSAGYDALVRGWNGDEGGWGEEAEEGGGGGGVWG